jgi:hypothetical protein
MQALCKVDKTSLVIDGEDGCQKAIRLSVLPLNRWLLKAFAYQSSETFQTEDRIQFCWSILMPRKALKQKKSDCFVKKMRCDQCPPAFLVCSTATHERSNWNWLMFQSILIILVQSVVWIIIYMYDLFQKTFWKDSWERLLNSIGWRRRSWVEREGMSLLVHSWITLLIWQPAQKDMRSSVCWKTQHFQNPLWLD